ncbi:DUF3883 domain-containing protein [Actinomadura opuntiae]|uniref:DUF3883 domain-containing protein n=1 Tax=Actinomadura sp. OS1-43 TaxID=604315 RepID=UPI00255B34D4|nr:DUF3883 domain-containing protein [Actinomadura sp. OS1-43]MDL4817733.1 DUF3883 domain-containing protein [Actinomadura sp. OS1-43]
MLVSNEGDSSAAAFEAVLETLRETESSVLEGIVYGAVTTVKAYENLIRKALRDSRKSAKTYNVLCAGSPIVARGRAPFSFQAGLETSVRSSWDYGEQREVHQSPNGQDDEPMPNVGVQWTISKDAWLRGFDRVSAATSSRVMSILAGPPDFGLKHDDTAGAVGEIGRAYEWATAQQHNITFTPAAQNKLNAAYGTIEDLSDSPDRSFYIEGPELHFVRSFEHLLRIATSLAAADRSMVVRCAHVVAAWSFVRRSIWDTVELLEAKGSTNEALASARNKSSLIDEIFEVAAENDDVTSVYGDAPEIVARSGPRRDRGNFRVQRKEGGTSPSVASTDGGNATKRIELRPMLPGDTAEDAARQANKLVAPTVREGRTVFTSPTGSLNRWWDQDPAERFWMEITDRPDLGSNLQALQRNGTGGEFWSYSLVTAIKPGDVVLHWHKSLHGQPGIVGHSIAADGPYDDQLIWDARGTYGQQRPVNTHPQPAWRYELTGYTPLHAPIGQQALRPLEDQLHAIKCDLEARINGPLYFPFVFSPSRPLRTAQAYLVKVPAAMLNLLPELARLNDLVPAASTSRRVLARLRRPRSRTGAGYLADPALRKAIEEHAVRRARDLYPDHDITDVGAICSYDLRAVKGDEEIHIEVKGSTGTADAVELTINEVTHARTTARTDLVVVDQITWQRQSDGTIQTSGGRCRHWTTWQPDEMDLRPTRYRYTLPN